MKRLNYYRIYNHLQSLYTFFHYHFGGGRAFAPLRYNINLTFKCNLSCPFCYIGNQRDCTELDTESWLAFIDTVPPFSLISYSGGEITLMPGFKKLLKRSLEKARVTFLTNGTAMDDELIDIIVQGKLFLIGISIDGLGDSHDEIRGVPGTFDKAVKCIEAIQAKRKNRKHPLIDVKTVILNENINQLYDIYRWADSLKVDVFTLSFLKGCNLQFNPTLEDTFSEKFYKQQYTVDRYFDMETFKRVYRQLLAFSEKSNTLLRFYPEFAPGRSEVELQKIEAFYGGGGNNRPQDIYHKCLYPWTELSIISNGDCFPCLSYKVGNIKDASVSQIWNNEKYVDFRRRLQKAGVFSSCQGCCYSRMK